MLKVEEETEPSQTKKALIELEDRMRLLTVQKDYMKLLTDDLILTRTDPEVSILRIRNFKDEHQLDTIRYERCLVEFGRLYRTTAMNGCRQALWDDKYRIQPHAGRVDKPGNQSFRPRTQSQQPRPRKWNSYPPQQHQQQQQSQQPHFPKGM
eukprot:GHVP01057393.1.p1 GENE.GHVP01057393.1~~GHVP01057393.1.p1  ORF type:complete len:152 (-),score=12.50 GHVP01057393.1:137-592(-)